MADRETGAGSKPPRPRDELGRPLPWGSENRLPMEDFDALPLEENDRLARRYWNDRNFFPAHEAWESCWKQSKGTDEAELFKGLSQLGAGYVHHRRGNPHGTKTLLRRGLSRIERYLPGRRGLDLSALAEAVREQADAVEAAQESGQDMPHIDPPRV